MISKKNIIKVEPNTEQWLKARLGFFTSSKAETLCKPKGFGVTGMKYIYSCVGEELSGQVLEKEIFSSSIAHGNMYETQAIEAATPFILKYLGMSECVGVKWFVTRDERNGSTPDMMLVLNETEDAYDVIPIEAKCPETYQEYINLSLCEKPSELKKANEIYYWQVLHQMFVCDSKIGMFVAYHPYMKIGGLHILVFNYEVIEDDYIFMVNRLVEAEKKFKEIRLKIINKDVIYT